MITIYNQGGLGRDYSKVTIESAGGVVNLGPCLAIRLFYTGRAKEPFTNVIVSAETVKDLVGALSGWLAKQEQSVSSLEGEL